MRSLEAPLQSNLLGSPHRHLLQAIPAVVIHILVEADHSPERISVFIERDGPGEAVVVHTVRRPG